MATRPNQPGWRKHTVRAAAPKRRGKASNRGENASRPSLIHLRRLKPIDRAQLPEPKTTWDQLDWIEVRGVPDYLDQRVEDANGAAWFVPPPVGAYPREIQRAYEDAFKNAVAADRLRVLRRFASNFPEYAFDPEGWLRPLWQEWRVRYEKVDRQFLEALAGGVSEKGIAWTSKIQGRLWLLAQAKRRLADWGGDAALKGAYRVYAESARSPNPTIRAEAEERLLPVLVHAIQGKTGYVTSAAELEKKKLSGVLRLAVARAFRLRERDLH